MNKLLDALNIEKGEERAVFLLLLQSFFIGIFFITLSVCAETLFLQTFNKEEIGKAYALSGVMGILLTGVYSFLQSKISFSKLSIITQIVIGGLLLGSWAGFGVIDTASLVFALFALMGPLYIIILVNFGGLLLRMFSLRQGKRLFSLVDSGAVFGIIIMGFLTPLLVSKIPDTKDLLLISTASMAMVLIIQFFISSSFSFEQKQSETKTEEIEKPKNTTLLLFKDKYVRSMAVFTVITMIALFLIQYMFLASTSSMYPEEDELAGFLGNFTASMMIFSFLIKTFVYSKLIKNYGLKVAFLIMPALLALFTVGAIIAGHVFGYENTSFQFVYFFLLISLSKLFSVALKDSIQTPSFKVLYQSLDKAIRFDIQAKIDGIVNEIAATMAGLLLAGLGLLAFLKIIHYNYLTSAICLVWCYFAFKLYNEYKGSLQESLEKFKAEDLVDQHNSEINFATIAKKQNNDKALTFARIYEPITLDEVLPVNKKPIVSIQNSEAITESEIEQLIKALKNSSIEIRVEATRLIANHKIEELYPKIADNLGLNAMKNAVAEGFIQIGDTGIPHIQQAFHKTGLFTEDLIFIIQLLGKIKSEKAIPFLEKNIEYPDYEVVKAVLHSLRTLGYQADESNGVKIHQLIDNSIQNIGWNIAALNKVEENNKVKPYLKEAIKTEIENGLDLLYLQLALVYDPNSIYQVQNNINSGVSESIGFAIELLDLFLQDELKPKLFPLLEDIGIGQKLSELRQHFAIHVGNTTELLTQIINKDYSLTSKYIKACAMRNLAEISDDVSIDVTANLFNPNELIRETTLFSILNKDPKLLQQARPRIPKHLLAEFDSKSNKLTKSENHLLLNKIFALKEIAVFASLKDNDLEKLAHTIDFKKASNLEKVAFVINPTTHTIVDSILDSQEYYIVDKDKLHKTILLSKAIGKSLYQLSVANNITPIAA